MRTIVVSGAGSGIGRATAERLAQSKDTRLVLLGRNLAKLSETKSKLPRPNDHEIVAADLRDAKALQSAFHELRLSEKNVTAVIANAGVGGENHYGPDDRWHEVIETNLTGTYYLINEALPALRASAQPYRHVVIVSSILSRLGIPKYSAYCASKAGLLGLMRSFAGELAPERILVNAICPGWVSTDMADAGIRDMAAASGRSVDEVLKQQMSYVPLGKMSEPDEIARLLEYLVSAEQKSITGQSIDINNGAWMGV